MKTIRVVVIEPTKPPELREIKGDLKTLQELVGGYIEMLFIDEECHGWVNDDGKRLGLTPNNNATAIMNQYGPGLIPGDPGIVGTMVIAGSGDEGDDIDVPESFLAKLGPILKR